MEHESYYIKKKGKRMITMIVGTRVGACKRIREKIKCECYTLKNV